MSTKTETKINTLFSQNINVIKMVNEKINQYKELSIKLDENVKSLNEEHKTEYIDIKKNYINLCSIYFEYTSNLKSFLINFKRNTKINDIDELKIIYQKFTEKEIIKEITDLCKKQFLIVVI